MNEDPWDLFNREFEVRLSDEVGVPFRLLPGKPAFCHRHLERYYRSHGAEAVVICFGVLAATFASRAWRTALRPVPGETEERQIRRRMDVLACLAPWCCRIGFWKRRLIVKRVKGQGDVLVAEHIYPLLPNGPALWKEWQELKGRIGTGKP